MADRTRQASYLPFYRRRFIVDRSYQVGFAWRLMGLILCGAVAFMALFWLLSQGVLSVTYRNYDIRIDSSTRILMPQMLLATGIHVVLTGLLAGVLTILMSHRVSGPIYRIARAIEEIRHGDLSVHIRLRRKDSAGDLAEAVNHMTREYAERLDSIRQSVDHMESELEASGTSMDPERTVKLRAAIHGVRRDLDFFQTAPKAGPKVPR